MWPRVTGANFPILVGGMPVSLHRHPHSGKNRRAMQKGEPAHDAVVDSAKRLSTISLRADRASWALRGSVMLGDSTLELGVCLGHYHPAKALARVPGEWGLLQSAKITQRQGRMGTSMAASNVETSPSRGGGREKVAIFAAKLLVTGACFWYVSRQIDLSQVLSAIPLLDFRWAALAILVAILEIPLLGLRWHNIVNALAAHDQQMARTAMIAVTAIGAFFSQVLPGVAAEGVRAWLLVRLGSNWRNAIDRGVGVSLLIMLGFVVLLLPSGLAAPGGYRNVVLVVYGALTLAGALGLWFAPTIVLRLARWRYSRWSQPWLQTSIALFSGRRDP